MKIIPREAFYCRRRLIDVEFHDGIERVEHRAFNNCTSLMGSIKLLGVKIIEEGAFTLVLAEVQFGVMLETLGSCAFMNCDSLSNVTMPSGRSIGFSAFGICKQLTDLDLPEGVETIQEIAFYNCNSLGRIAIPLKSDIEGNAFIGCTNLTTMDLVGGIHRTVASLHLEEWKNEMKGEINRINEILPNTTSSQKTAEIQEWMRAVISRLDHYKAEHNALLKEATTLLELALWKAKIEENEGDSLGDVMAKRATIDVKSKRSERRITSGANIVIKNALPFLELN